MVGIVINVGIIPFVTSTRKSATCFSSFALGRLSLHSKLCCLSTVAGPPINYSMSFSSNMSTTDLNPTRRSGNYKPTTWDFEYIQSIKNDYVGEKYMKRFNKLKKEVQKMIMVEGDQELDQLKLIDNLQRLGVSYHFKEEIMQILSCIHQKTRGNSDADSLYSTALKFRLLRSHAFDISEDILTDFKDESGNLKQSTWDDTNGLLQLYEASFLSTETETTLKYATKYTVAHLKKYLHDNNHVYSGKDIDIMVELVLHALELPRHWIMPRLETVWYISVYERMSNPNPLLLEFAKLDFNIVQAAHQEELKTLSRWWKSTYLAEMCPFSRDILAENFFMAVGIITEPRHSYCRGMLTTVISVITVIDDIYDVYGTLDELEVFTDAVERWEIRTVEQLPDYMKVCYLTLINTSNEFAEEVLKEQGVNILPYITKAWSDLCKAYIREARWYYNRYMPTLQEYMDNAWVSVGVHLVLVHGFIFVTNPITKEALEFISKYPDIIRWCGRIFRLADDLGTSSEELKRGDVPKSIQCYMNEKGVTEEEARKNIKLVIKETWELINKHKREEELLYSGTFIEMTLNISRTSHCVYQYGDGYEVQNSPITDRISKILFEPITIS